MGTHERDIYTKAIKAEENVTGKRWCSQCQYGKIAKGGEWIKSLNGLQRRWMCKDCYERKLAREKK